MAGLLLELRRQIARGRDKSSYKTVRRTEPAGTPAAHPRTAAQEPAQPEQVQTEPEHQEQVQERNKEIVSREDFLLNQIDEFRERARQLQSLLDSRESEAQELQTLVDERQEKADELGKILEERQQKADGFTAELEKQIDSLIGKVAVKMEEIETSMKADAADGKRLNEEKAQEIKDSLAQIEEQLTAAKTELSEKVHSENVKCYRNISDLFRSMEERLDRLEVLQAQLTMTKRFSAIGMAAGILNLAGLVVVALIGLGIIAL